MHDNWECLFCHEDLHPHHDAENLAFRSHLRAAPGCRAEFEAWSDNLADDFLGD